MITITNTNTNTNRMVIQNSSIEGAYDAAIEDAASRIHLASRPQLTTASSSSSSNSSSSSAIIEETPSNDNDDADDDDDDDVDVDVDNVVVAADKNGGAVLSLSPNINNSDEISALDGDSGTSVTSTSDDYTDDDDIESSILFLEEKKRILKRAKTSWQREEAYIADNAHDIASGQEPSSCRVGSSSVWLEAKAYIEEFKIVGGGAGGGSNEEEDGNSPDMVSSSLNNDERQGRTSPPSSADICLSSSPLSLSPADFVVNAYPTPKRQKIDVSMVEQISSTKFAEDHYHVRKEVPYSTQQDDSDGRWWTTASTPSGQNYLSPMTRCQQASDMQLATDSRHWISQAVLKEITTLTNAAVAEHRRSLIAANGNWE